jgi:hypothetical protein
MKRGFLSHDDISCASGHHEAQVSYFCNNFIFFQQIITEMRNPRLIQSAWLWEQNPRVRSPWSVGSFPAMIYPTPQGTMRRRFLISVIISYLFNKLLQKWETHASWCPEAWGILSWERNPCLMVPWGVGYIIAGKEPMLIISSFNYGSPVWWPVRAG